MADLSIIMPVYNERATVAEAIHQTLEADLPVQSLELVVVDDGSTDGTRELLGEGSWDGRVRVLMHEQNGGKGRAVRTALEHAEGTYAAIMDADLEYDPDDLAGLLEPLLSGEAEVVFGTRGFASHSAFSFWYVMGNKAVTLTANLLFNSWLADIMTCQKAMRTDLWRSLSLTSKGFTIEPEITAKVLAAGYQVYEVPVRYNARGRQEGKKLTALDGVRVLGTLVGCRLGAGGLRSRKRHHAEAATDASSETMWDLEQLAAARGLCDWMFSQFADVVGPSVAEVGAGIGTFTGRLLDACAEHVLAIEPEPACASELERRFASDPRVEVAGEALPESPALAALGGRCDLVLCQNVLEHIEDDSAAVAAMARALRPGGTLLLLVPAHPRLYGTMDRSYGHCRRYDRERLRGLVVGAGLSLDRLYFFNLLGIPGWWVNNRRHAGGIGAGSLRAYEALLKLWRPVEERVEPRWGLSLIARARKTLAD